jgi:hypothetical protein
LRRAAADAQHAALKHGEPQLAAERPRDFDGLVVAALAQSSRMQRHGNERVDVRSRSDSGRREQ